MYAFWMLQASKSDRASKRILHGLQNLVAYASTPFSTANDVAMSRCGHGHSYSPFAVDVVMFSAQPTHDITLRSSSRNKSTTGDVCNLASAQHTIAH